MFENISLSDLPAIVGGIFLVGVHIWMAFIVVSWIRKAFQRVVAGRQRRLTQVTDIQIR